MITPFKLPDNKVPIKVGDDSYIYKDVYNPIGWVNGEPFRPRVETLVLHGGTHVFAHVTRKGYRIPGGSIDADSSYEKQAENETNEEALIGVKDLKYSGISYTRPMDPNWLKKGGDGALAYTGSFNYVYVANWDGKSIDRSTIEEKDLDDDMAQKGTWHPILQLDLDREHMEALVNSGMLDKKVEAALRLKLDETSYSYNKRAIYESGNGLGPLHKRYIFHGSTYKFDVFHPMSLDLGNANEKPGWSTFCFEHYSYAKRFALMRALQKYTDPLAEKEPAYKVGWDLRNSRPYINREVFAEVFNKLKGTPLYIYTIDASKLELGVGNDERFPEYTFRKDNVPYEIREVVYIDKSTMLDDVTLLDGVSADDFEKEQMENLPNLNRGWMARMLNRDYSGDSAVTKLTTAVSKGELKPGDDVEKYMREHNITLQEIGYLDHLQENVVLDENLTLNPANKEMTIYLGDNRVLMSPTNYDKYFSTDDVELIFMLPRNFQFDNTDVEVYRYYMYLLNNNGNPNEVVGFCDIVNTSLNDEAQRYYCIRVYVIPRCRRLGLGDVLANYAIRYIISDLDTGDCTATMVVIHKQVASISKIENWIKSKGLMKGIPAEGIPEGGPSIYTRVFSSAFPDSIEQYKTTTENNEAFNHTGYPYTTVGDLRDPEGPEQLLAEPYLGSMINGTSTLEDTQKGRLQLSQFKLTKLSDGAVDKYFWKTQDGHPVATCFIENGVDGKFNWIHNFHVSDEYRGYGLGTQMLDYAVDIGKGNSLSVYPDNDIAVRMYKKYGFKVGKASENDVKTGKNSLYFMYYPLKMSRGDVVTANETRLSKTSETAFVSEAVAFNNKCPKSVKLYHASTNQNLKYIDPKHESINNVVGNIDAIYASNDPRFSACFGVKWHDDVARQGSWDNWETVTFGVSDKVDLDKPCSMYELENDGKFTQIKTKEFIATHSVKVKKEIKFKSGREMLDKYGVEVITLDDYYQRLRATEGTVIDLTENFELVTEEQANLTRFSFYKALLSSLEDDIDNTPNWEGKPYQSSMDEAIQAEIDRCRNNNIPISDERNTLNMYTIWDNGNICLLGQVTVRMFSSGKFDWEWDNQIDCSEELARYIREEQKSMVTPKVVEESWEDNKFLKPIYIILTYTGTKFGKLIKAWQKTRFSHAGLSLNPKMDKVYTFNMRSEIGEDGKKKILQGADVENIEDYTNPEDNGDADIAVMAIFVTNDIYDAVKNGIEKIFSSIDKTRYNVGNVVNVVLNRAVETKDSMKMICSQFVDYVLKAANVDISHKSSNITTPKDFWLAAQENPNVFLLYDGKKSKYNPKSISRKAAYIRHSDKYGNVSIKREAITEAFTVYKEDFVKGKPLSLSSFKKTPISKQSLYRFRQSELCRELRHIDDYDTGYIYTDNNKFVAVVAVDTSDDRKYNWITAIEVGKDYQGHGLSKQLLDVATKELGGNALSAHSDNRVAIEAYKKYGFKESEESKDKMKTRVFMYYGEALKESFDAYITDILTENVIFNKDNTLYNVDKFESGKSNILLVTGLSGSGKSTLAQEYAKKYKAEWIELDIFETADNFTDAQLKQAGDVYVEYFDENPDVLERLRSGDLSFQKGDWAQQVRKMMKFAIRWCKQHKDKKYIIEGVQIYSCLGADEVKGYPIIIMGTSAKNSILQRFKRNAGGGDIDWGKELKNEFSNLIQWYWDEEKKLTMFEKDMGDHANSKVPKGGAGKMRLATESGKLIKSLNLLLEADDNDDEGDDEDDEQATDYTELDEDNDDSEDGGDGDNEETSTTDGDQATDYTDDDDSEDDDNPTDYTDEVSDDEPDDEEDTGSDGEGTDEQTSGDDGETGDTEEDDTGDGDTDSGEDSGSDDDLGATDYTDSAGEGDDGGDTEDTSEDSDDSSDDTSDDSDSTTEDDNQNTNNRIKNYSILKDYERLYRLANEMGETLDPIIMEKPIQNKVVTQIKENIIDIKEAIMWFVQFGMSDKYAVNLYYYEVFVNALMLNVQMLEKNKEFSDKIKKKLKTKKK